MRHAALILVFFVLLIACEKDQAKIDDKIIRDYLEEHDLEATAHSSGLYYHIIELGTGGRPDLYSTIEVKYKGYLTDGTVFDQTEEGETMTAILYNMIEGWQIGIPMMKRGGKGIFYIPSEMGYGDYEMNDVPANSVLIFEIELVSITTTQ